MHIATSTVPIRVGHYSPQPPGRYLMCDSEAGELLAAASGGECRLEPFVCPTGFVDTSRIPDSGVVTILRPGRYGDLILLSPCLREIKRRWPKCVLQVSCLEQYREALMGLPYIDNFLPYPLPMDEVERNCDVLTLEPVASLSGREKELHMTDLFAERLGLGDIENKKPDFFLSIDERTWAHEAYPRSNKKRVAVQIKSSTPSRDYPPKLMADTIKMLMGRNWDVVLLGLPNEIKGTLAGITNCAEDKPTFRQSAAVLATADVFLGPDSSLIHVAGALGTPAVGLFSVVPWELRTKYCPTTFVIQAKKGCDLAPCFHAPRGAAGFPAAGPCQKERLCCALATIDPREVVAKVEQSAR